MATEARAMSDSFWTYCRSPKCGLRVQMRKNPSGKWQPFDPPTVCADCHGVGCSGCDNIGRRVLPHHATCKDVESFRSARAPAKPKEA